MILDTLIVLSALTLNQETTDLARQLGVEKLDRRLSYLALEHAVDLNTWPDSVYRGDEANRIYHMKGKYEYITGMMPYTGGPIKCKKYGVWVYNNRYAIWMRKK